MMVGRRRSWRNCTINILCSLSPSCASPPSSLHKNAALEQSDKIQQHRIGGKLKKLWCQRNSDVLIYVYLFFYFFASAASGISLTVNKRWAEEGKKEVSWETLQETCSTVLAPFSRKTTRRRRERRGKRRRKKKRRKNMRGKRRKKRWKRSLLTSARIPAGQHWGGCCCCFWSSCCCCCCCWMCPAKRDAHVSLSLLLLFPAGEKEKHSHQCRWRLLLQFARREKRGNAVHQQRTSMFAQVKGAGLSEVVRSELLWWRRWF